VQDRGGTDEPEAARAAGERLLRAWRGEIEARRVYDVLRRREPDARRAEILGRIADAEATHRQRIESRLTELGVPVPDPASVRISFWLKLQARLAPMERLLRAREAAEDDEVGDVYGSPTGDPQTDSLLTSIRKDERSHSMAMSELVERREGPPLDPAQSAARSRLDKLLGRERWHRSGTGWISDAVYGANDGLAAVFGIVAGVSGATNGSDRFVLTSGLAGAIASALSMGVGAWLASRSTSELAAANLEQERRELREHPAEEKEELSLFYQLKGLSRADADELVEKLARNPEAMLQTLVAEEFGGLDSGGNPWTAALAGFVSTGLGAMIPVVPFFFVGGTTGLVWAAAVSLLAHFAVGAAKSLFTLRSWWGAGLEMTGAGVLVGGATYALGLIFKIST
jgi:VIT1/CCC1 family predicted Fe2+/Mn2+ transporter